MKDRHVVKLEHQVRQMSRELRRLRRAAGLGLVCVCGVTLFLLFAPVMYVVVALLMILGIFAMAILSIVICSGVAVKMVELLYYKWLRRHFRRKDAQLRAEQVRMRHSGLSLKSLVG
jgi:hypothetical protein